MPNRNELCSCGSGKELVFLSPSLL
ncbi:SEC-C metal-binding domain-containing protein [Paenibacillus mangrovi]